MILAPLQKLPKNVGDLGKLIVAKGFKKSPKVQKIANSGHTGPIKLPSPAYLSNVERLKNNNIFFPFYSIQCYFF